MIKVKDGYAKLVGTTASGSASHILLSNGGVKAVSDFALKSELPDVSKYLPLTGGTLILENGDSFKIKRNKSNSYGSYIAYETNDGMLGRLGMYKENVEVYFGSLTDKSYNILHEGNFNSYAPKLDGTGASGTWNINISGDADTLDGEHGSWYQNHVHSFDIVNISALYGAGASTNVNTLKYGMLYNYGSSDYWVNAPVGMLYGLILNLKNSNTYDLAGQLAWDINHNSTTDTTRYLWWRATDDGTWTEAKWHRIAYAEEIPTVTNYYWANVPVSSSSSTTTSPTFATATAGQFIANNTSGPHFTGTSVAGNWAYLRLNNSSCKWDIATKSTSGSGGLWLSRYEGADNGIFVSASTTPKIGINTSSPSYALHVSGDSYTSSWSRAGSGFYVEGTGVHYTSQGGVGEIDIISNNEFVYSTSNGTLYFNYRGASRGTTVTNYIWNAGSATTFANHTLGNLTSKGNLTMTYGYIWVLGGSAAGGNSNRLTTTTGMPGNMLYNVSRRGTLIYSNGIAFADPYNGNNNNDSGWIRHIETTANTSILEIATGDDGDASEEIRFRGYNTSNTINYDILVPKASGTLALVGLSYTKSEADSRFLLRRRMTNPSDGTAYLGAIPYALALKSAGTPLYGDPEFASGTNNCMVYNNSGNSTVAVSRIADNQGSANSSGYILQIVNNGGTSSPGRGGFYLNISARQNAVFAQIFRAKIPTGFNVCNGENPMGNGYTTYWLTDTAGTGKWEWYIRITICGSGGTYSSGGHVYLNGSGAVTWYLSYCNVIDLTRGSLDGLRSIYSRYVVGDNNAASPGYSLLQSGSGRTGASPGGDTWIYWDTLGGTASPWGILHEQGSNYISFYGAGNRRSFINLSDGCVYGAHFYENSDIRYKTIINNLAIKANQLANLPLFDFKWEDNENLLNTGTSAQAVRELLPHIVSGTDKLTLDYGVLGTITGITACKELTEQEKEINKLKEQIKFLKDEINNLKTNKLWQS